MLHRRGSRRRSSLRSTAGRLSVPRSYGPLRRKLVPPWRSCPLRGASPTATCRPSFSGRHPWRSLRRTSGPWVRGDLLSVCNAALSRSERATRLFAANDPRVSGAPGRRRRHQAQAGRHSQAGERLCLRACALAPLAPHTPACQDDGRSGGGRHAPVTLPPGPTRRRRARARYLDVNSCGARAAALLSALHMCLITQKNTQSQKSPTHSTTNNPYLHVTRGGRRLLLQDGTKLLEEVRSAKQLPVAAREVRLRQATATLAATEAPAVVHGPIDAALFHFVH